jgi:hypothetical protein
VKFTVSGILRPAEFPIEHDEVIEVEIIERIEAHDVLPILKS